MNWFHESQQMGWLVVFWIASFVFFLAAFWLMSRSNQPRKAKPMRRPTDLGHPGSSPKPSM